MASIYLIKQNSLASAHQQARATSWIFVKKFYYIEVYQLINRKSILNAISLSVIAFYSFVCYFDFYTGYQHLGLFFS